RLAVERAQGETFIVDTHGENLEMLPPLDDPNDWFDVWSWSPDGRWLGGRRVTKGAIENKGLLLYAFDSRRYVQVLDYGLSAAWLRDNKTLLFLDQNKIRIVDRISHRVRDLVFLPLAKIDSLALSQDARWIYFSAIAQ